MKNSRMIFRLREFGSGYLPVLLELLHWLVLPEPLELVDVLRKNCVSERDSSFDFLLREIPSASVHAC